jgi:hypothetical protein
VSVIQNRERMDSKFIMSTASGWFHRDNAIDLLVNVASGVLYVLLYVLEETACLLKT